MRRLLLAAALVSACGTARGVHHHNPPRAVSAPTVVRRTFTISYSVGHRQIEAVQVGGAAATHPLLVVGCIHGNEPAGIAVARWLIAHPGAHGPGIWVVPDLNPDGVAAGTRQNAHGVDLNRNFPFRWAPLHAPGDLFYQGPRPLSEPESRAAYRLIRQLRPGVTIWFHQHQNLVDLTGGDPRIERRFAALVGLPVAHLTRYGGSAAVWANHAVPAGTSFVVELPAGSLSAAETVRYARAVITLARELPATVRAP
jgi:protein MpaA